MTSRPRELPAEWDAAINHRVPAPRVTWGGKVLERLALLGDETVVDVGCGNGRLNADLLERLPHGRVITVGRSANMLAEAAARLGPLLGERVSLLRADVQDLELPKPADAIFSQLVQPVVVRALPDALFNNADRCEFMAQRAPQSVAATPAYTLDYWRRNLAASRPTES